MAKYTITAPNGSSYDVEAPDDATEAEVMAYVQEQTANDNSNERGMGEELGRQVGLTGRAAVTGIAGIPNLIGDAANTAINLGTSGINTAFGTKIPALAMPSQVTQDAMTSMGVPQPENMMERIANVGGAALAGAGGATRVATAVRDMPVMQMVLQELGRGPNWQAAGALAGATAVEGVKEAGVDNPLALAGAAIVGSTIPGAGLTGARRGIGAAAQLAAPFRSVEPNGLLPGISREVIAGKVLNKFATTPGITPQVMSGAREIVPDSAPTISQASRDPGLIAAESGIRNALDGGAATSGRIGQRLSQQNSARQAELDRITLPSVPVPPGGTPQRGTLEYAQAKRDRAVTQNQAAAFRNAGSADTAPVLQSIDSVLRRPTGAKAAVQQAMTFARGRLEQGREDLSNPETLYAIRQDINDYRLGKYVGDDQGSARLAGSELREVIGSLDNAIDQAAPGYRRYMELYAKRSRPLDQQEALRDLRERGQVSGSDPVSQERILTLGKYGTAVRKAISTGALANTVDGAKLSDAQLRTIQNVVDDLDRASAPNAATMKVPGSDSFKNFSVASIIGRIVGDNLVDAPGGKAMQTIAKPLAWMYTLPDEAIGQLLVEATLDPRLASRLMRQASAYEVQSIAAELAQRAAAQAKGAVVYSNAANRPERPARQ